MRSGRLSAIGGGIALLLLTGCVAAPGTPPSPTASDRKGDGVGTTQPELTVENAKRIAQGIENDIVAAFPERSVRTVEQTPDGVLLRCSADRAYSWIGRTTVALTPYAEPQNVIETVTTAYRNNDELVPEDITEGGLPGVQLNGPYGSGYVVSGEQSGNVTIDSFSPCFVLPEGKSSSARY